MNKKKLLITIILLTVHVKTAVALSLTAKVDKTEATLDDQIILTLSVEGTQRAGRPDLPPLPAFEVIPRGSSTRMQIINGQITSGIDYNYLLIPKKTGVFEIAPATLRDNGTTIYSNTITITITSADTQPRTSKDIFLTASVSNNHPYVNEQTIYTIKFFRSLKIANATLEHPSFEGFRVEPLGKEKEYETIINGKPFVVTVLRQALFPTREGTLEISPAKVQCEVIARTRRRSFFDDPFFDDPFFGLSRTEPKVLHSNAITLEVKPLPGKGKTPLFSGLVGNFSIDTSISKKQLQVGDTTTLTITIKGIGNIRDASIPELPISDDFKIYDDKPVISIHDSSENFGGSFTIKKALVPLKEGSFQLPAVALTYFDPARSTYELCKSAPLFIEALPPVDKEKLQLVEALGTTTSKEEIKILGKDILPITTSPAALKPHHIDPWHWSFLVSFLVPIIGYGGTVLIKKRKERLEEDSGFLRSKNALKNFNKKIPALKKSTKNENSVEFCRLSSRALKDFFGDKFNITGSALTPVEVEHRLSSFSLPHEKIKEIQRVLHTLELGQFASQQLSMSEKEKLLKQIRNLVQWLDKKIKRYR